MQRATRRGKPAILAGPRLQAAMRDTINYLFYVKNYSALIHSGEGTPSSRRGADPPQHFVERCGTNCMGRGNARWGTFFFNSHDAVEFKNWSQDLLPFEWPRSRNRVEKIHSQYPTLDTRKKKDAGTVNRNHLFHRRA